MTPLITLLSIALLASDCSAQPPGRGRKEQGKPGAGQQRGPGMDRDPAQMVQRMIQEFDKDGDKKLDSRELTAMFTAMKDRRENGGGRPGNADGPRRRPMDGQKGQRPDGAGRRQRGNADTSGTAGGDKPKRPPAE